VEKMKERWFLEDVPSNQSIDHSSKLGNHHPEIGDVPLPDFIARG